MPAVRAAGGWERGQRTQFVLQLRSGGGGAQAAAAGAKWINAARLRQPGQMDTFLCVRELLAR